MEKKNIDWSNLGFGYMQTDMRYVSTFRDGAWDEGGLTDKATIEMSECACVLQYAQTCFEGMKAYTTADGKIVCFRPDLNAERMVQSAERLKMPPFPAERFLEAIKETVKANAEWVPPYGSGASLYIRPYMFGYNSVIGVKPATDYQFRVFVTPVGPYFKGGIKPLTLRISDLDRAAPRGTGHIKAGLNYAMSLHAIVTAHEEGFDENMYLDAATRTKVEETGGANFLFVTKDGKKWDEAGYEITDDVPGPQRYTEKIKVGDNVTDIMKLPCVQSAHKRSGKEEHAQVHKNSAGLVLLLLSTCIYVCLCHLRLVYCYRFCRFYRCAQL
mgnify:CR=1 FL=1